MGSDCRGVTGLGVTPTGPRNNEGPYAAPINRTSRVFPLTGRRVHRDTPPRHLVAGERTARAFVGRLAASGCRLRYCTTGELVAPDDNKEAVVALPSEAPPDRQVEDTF